MEKFIAPIIIPSYEPDDRLLMLLKDLHDNDLQPVVIVDDGSSAEYQHYFERAREEYHAIVLKHDINKGKGRALKTAFAYCLDHYPDIVGCITADSDGQHTVEAIAECKLALRNKKKYLILGVREFDHENVPVKSQFGNNLTRKVFRTLYRVNISDTQTGLRGIPADFMKELLDVPGERFEFETRMLIKAVEMEIEIEEIPIETVYDSKENHSTHFRPIVDSVRIYKVFGFSFGRFLLSSLSSSVVDLILFQILCLLLGRSVGGVKYVAFATIGARVISATYNYLINYFFVFASKERHYKSLIKYILLAITQMTCSAVCTTLLVAWSGADIELWVKIPVDACLFLVSYQIQKRVVY